MLEIAAVVLPVFLVIGAGYLAAWRGLLSSDHVDGLMRFGQGIAIPVLLFRALSRLDLASGFDPAFLGAFYGGATAGFLAGLFGARLIFGRPWEDAVAIGFVGLFSNSLMLGLSITERAYGSQALAGNFVIISVHSPFCYALGITAMEIVRSRQGGVQTAQIAPRILRGMATNPLIIGITLGLVVNLLGLALPEPVTTGLDLIAAAGIPAALFGLGGILLRFRPEGDLRTIVYITAVSLILHPMVTWTLGRALGLDTDAMRSAVVTAAMAPGVNAYLFADMYGRGRRVAASAVLFGTVGAIFTAAFWIAVLP